MVRKSALSLIISLLFFCLNTRAASFYTGLNYTFAGVVSEDDIYNGAYHWDPGIILGVQFGRLTLDSQIKQLHMKKDYEKDGAVKLNETFDLGWSVAVSEHIDASASDYYVETFTHCRWILFTWCTPGYGGYHHVNEQPLEYWIPKFEKCGMYIDIEKSKLIKESNRLQMVKHTDWSTALRNKRKGFLSLWATVFENRSI